LVFSAITVLFPKKIHFTDLRGFGLKNRALLAGFSNQNGFHFLISILGYLRFINVVINNAGYRQTETF